MKYSELSDKDRWVAIRAGVRAGYTSIDDIEKAYNEFAEGGEISHKFEGGSKITSYNDTGDTIEVGKALDEVTVKPSNEWIKNSRKEIYNDIKEHPEKLFNIGTDKNYNKWYMFFKRTRPEYLEDVWKKMSSEKQEEVFKKNPAALRLLSNETQVKFFEDRTRAKMDEAAPYAAMIPMAAFNPAAFALGTIGGMAVDQASIKTTGNSWGDNVASVVDKVTGLGMKDDSLGMTIANMTNPGYLLTGRAVGRGFNNITK